MSWKYLSFDIEIYNELKDGDSFERDFSEIIPSVGAWGIDYTDVNFYYDKPFMTKETAQRLVGDMWCEYQKGRIPFTWNGLSFDFALLAQYSEMPEMCGRLALNGVDGMMLVVCHKGFMLGLDKALAGAGLESKLHQVKLNDGTTMFSMEGSKAPKLWRDGEYEAVKEYLRVDVIQPLKLADHIESTGELKWVANSGNKNTFRTKMLTVKEALKLPVPNTSWMKTPPKSREEFYSWIPERVLSSEGII